MSLECGGEKADDKLVEIFKFVCEVGCNDLDAIERKKLFIKNNHGYLGKPQKKFFF